MKRTLLTIVPLLLAGLYVVAPPPASAAPGGDATLVVQSATVDKTGSSSYHLLTKTTMCPPGMRATGGGAYPATADLTHDMYRVYYTAPVDESGLASNTSDQDVPRGWQVTVNLYDTDADAAFRFFAICSANSDAVIAATQVPSGEWATATCPNGMRALGGGVGKVNDAEIPNTTSTTFVLYESSPVDSSGTVAGTQAGDIATGWRSRAWDQPFGRRFFAICSAASDATVATSTFTTPASNGAGGGGVSCPPGTRAMSGGLGTDTPPGDGNYRPEFSAPVAAASALAGVTTGTVSDGFFFTGKATVDHATTYRVFAMCATNPPVVVADSTPPDTTVTKGPKKQTLSTKAKFTFSSEAGATFTCALDKKPAVACTSPFKVKKLKPGKHKMTITAKDAAGNADQTPVIYKWKVKKKQPKPAPSGCTGECRMAARDGYHGYVACSTKSSAKPAHECMLSQTKAAFFVSGKHDATFKVCVKYPKGQRLCASDQSAPKGTKQFVTLATASIGRHKVSWYVDHKKVEGWTFEVVEG